MTRHGAAAHRTMTSSCQDEAVVVLGAGRLVRDATHLPFVETTESMAGFSESLTWTRSSSAAPWSSEMSGGGGGSLVEPHVWLVVGGWWGLCGLIVCFAL